MALQKFASGSQIRVAYTKETAFNVTPATPQLLELPKQSFTMVPTKELITDPTITSDRLRQEDRHGNLMTGGDLVVSLRHGIYDDLLAAGFGGAWTNNVLKNGALASTAPDSFTFEKGNVAFANYERFTGVRVNTINIEVNPGSIVTTTIGLVGAGITTATTPLDTDVPALPSKRAMSHVGGSIKVGGTNAICTAFTFNLDNGMEAQFGIGSSTAQDVTWADSNVTFSATFYVEDDLANFNYFLNEVTTSIELTLTDGEETYTLLIPRAKFNEASAPLTGPGVMFMTVSGTASKDDALGASAVLTRSAL